MTITFDLITFRLSGITPKEYKAISEFMKLAKLTSENHTFSIIDCNTADPELTEIGKQLSNQIKDFVPVPYDNDNDPDDEDDEDDSDPTVKPRTPINVKPI